MNNSVVKTVVLAVLLQVYCVWASPRWESENSILESILNRDRYNPQIRPGQNASNPVTVTTNMYIRNIAEIDDTKTEYSLEVTFRQEWKDERLEYEDQPGIKYLTMHQELYRIWSPDPFFSNEINGHFHNIMKPNVLLRIYPDGQILYSTRLSLTLRCPMDLKYYPMDRQTCSILTASYGYTTEDIVFLWKSESPVQISKNLQISQFSIKKVSVSYCTSRTITGEYSCIKVDLLFRREFNRYFIDVYLPTIVLVIISWLCFALDHKDTTARVVLFATVFIVFSLKLLCFNNKVPVTSYQTAYSVWMTTCFLFLVAVIAKIGSDAFILRRQRKTDDFILVSDEDDAVKNKLSSEEEPRTNVNVIFKFYYRLMRRYPSAQQKTDVICLILFPVAFALFNVFYWSLNMRNDD